MGKKASGRTSTHPKVQPAAASLTATDPIKHVIVLALENRSSTRCSGHSGSVFRARSYRPRFLTYYRRDPSRLIRFSTSLVSHAAATVQTPSSPIKTPHSTPSPATNRAPSK